MSTPSKFVWHDLMSVDVEKSKRFYGELFNWRIWSGKEGDPYFHISVGNKDVGGMMQLDPKHGAPSHWVGYISTDDVDGVVSKTQASGGKILAPVQDMPKVGRFAVLADAQGGVFSPFKSAVEMTGSDAKPAPGEFCWDELMVNDPSAAVAFYEKTFGWTHDSMEMPDFGTYSVLKAGTTNIAGVAKPPPGAPPMGYWLTYIAADDTDAVVARSMKLGATVLSPAMNIPDVGRFAVLMDDTQGTFAILGPGK